MHKFVCDGSRRLVRHHGVVMINSGHSSLPLGNRPALPVHRYSKVPKGAVMGGYPGPCAVSPYAWWCAVDVVSLSHKILNKEYLPPEARQCGSGAR